MGNLFITGGTGYIGRFLTPRLLEEGHHIKALVRSGSENRLASSIERVTGNALDALSYQDKISPSDTFIHLVGVARPSPAKNEEFINIDLVSIKEAVKAATHSGVKHFIYLSVAQHPTSIMKEYQTVRAEGEKILIMSGIPSTILRPWYVLGPGHWWPLLLKPFYWILKNIPSLKTKALKLDTVTIEQMIKALLQAVNHIPDKTAYYEVENIKKFD